MGWLLLLLAVGLGSRGKGGGNGAPNGNGGTGNGNGNGNGGTGNGGDGYPGGPASVGPVPDGEPPGGCHLAFESPASTVSALNMLGYTPNPEIWGPDEVLGTYDADEDMEVRQFQLDYNQASRSGWLGNEPGWPGQYAGGLMPDGLMGRCTMAAMAHADVWRGAQAWRARYMPKVHLGGVTG